MLTSCFYYTKQDELCEVQAYQSTPKSCWQTSKKYFTFHKMRTNTFLLLLKYMYQLTHFSRIIFIIKVQRTKTNFVLPFYPFRKFFDLCRYMCCVYQHFRCKTGNEITQVGARNHLLHLCEVFRLPDKGKVGGFTRILFVF